MERELDNTVSSRLRFDLLKLRPSRRVCRMLCWSSADRSSNCMNSRGGGPIEVLINKRNEGEIYIISLGTIVGEVYPPKGPCNLSGGAKKFDVNGGVR